jgi:hypothetical protein
MADREETVAGITLRQYAIVVAGRADELPLVEVLALAEVPAKTWRRAEEAWGERLLADFDADGSLADELTARLTEARNLWERPLPPLDGDLAAWLDFERAWEGAVEGDAFLTGVGMRPADMLRLQDLWAERMAADASLVREVVRVRAEEPRPHVRPMPGPVRIRAGEMGRTG